MDPYALIAQYPNAGQAFSDAYNKGQQQNALMGFAMHPDDPNAQGSAARFDPAAVMQYRQQEQSQHQGQAKQQLDEWHKYAGDLAKWADTPDKRDQAIDYLLSHNHPDVSTEQLLALKQMPPEQWQGVRANFMALGGVQDDKPQQPASGIQEYQYYLQQQKAAGKPPMPFEQFAQILHPGMSSPVTIPYGATVQSGGEGAGGELPSVASPQDAMKLPPGSQFKLPDGRIGTVPGGAGGNASGGFPQ